MNLIKRPNILYILWLIRYFVCYNWFSCYFITTHLIVAPASCLITIGVNDCTIMTTVSVSTGAGCSLTKLAEPAVASLPQPIQQSARSVSFASCIPIVVTAPPSPHLMRPRSGSWSGVNESDEGESYHIVESCDSTVSDIKKNTRTFDTCRLFQYIVYR